MKPGVLSGSEFIGGKKEGVTNEQNSMDDRTDGVFVLLQR